MELAQRVLSPETIGQLQQLYDEYHRDYDTPGARALLDRLAEIRWTTPAEYVRMIDLIFDGEPGGEKPPIQELAVAAMYVARSLCVILDQFMVSEEEAIQNFETAMMFAMVAGLFYGAIQRVNDRLMLRDPRYDRQCTVGLN